jgi:tRNA threonylcarbamoyladenosine modification (KEOPS) complex Cgi121 subunit
MPRDSTFLGRCWEVKVGPDEVEGLLAQLRKENPIVMIQVFGADSAPNTAAVEMVAAQTLTAVKSGATLAERPELDLLLRLAGTRQIGEAFRRAGYKSIGKRLFLVAASDGNGGAMGRLASALSKDVRFKERAKKKLGKMDFQMVERAALLAVRL